MTYCKTSKDSIVRICNFTLNSQGERDEGFAHLYLPAVIPRPRRLNRCAPESKRAFSLSTQHTQSNKTFGRLAQE